MPTFDPQSTIAAPRYTQAGPQLIKFHPLAEGILGFPLDLQTQPQEFYSYADAGERLVFARLSGFWKRLLAVVVDAFVMFLALVVVAFIDAIIENKVKVTPPPNGTGFTAIELYNSNSQNTLLPLYVALAYYFLTGIIGKGQSVGKRVLKLRVMRLDGQKPDVLTAAVRYLVGYLLSANFLGLALVVLILLGLNVNTTVSGFIALFFVGWGFYWAGWDALKQGWHDKLARTLVVDVREYVEGVHFFRADE